MYALQLQFVEVAIKTDSIAEALSEGVGWCTLFQESGILEEVDAQTNERIVLGTVHPKEVDRA